MRYSHEQIDRLIRPKTVAVIGATDRVGALGATLLNNLVQFEFQGAIYPVNPKREELFGLKVYPSVDQLPRDIDCAVLAIPRSFVLTATRELAMHGCSAVVIYSAGFSETGEEGLRDQEALAGIAHEFGTLILGPNCLGATNYIERIPLTFVETNMKTPTPDIKTVGIISQSGALATVLSTHLHSRGCYLSHSVSTGNEAASGVEDYLPWMIDDPHTNVIVMFLETVRYPNAFLASAKRAYAAGKPLIVLHPGKSNQARVSAATHTGAIASDYALMKVKLSHEGVIFAETLEELGDIAMIAVTSKKLPGKGLAVLAESGALRGLAFDLTEELGLKLLELNNEDSPALRTALPDFVPVSNPLDITAAGLTDPDIYTRTLTALLEDDRVGTVLAAIIQTDPVTCQIKFPSIMKVFENGTARKSLLFAGVDDGAHVPEKYIEGLRKIGIPWFPSTERAYRAITRLTVHDEWKHSERVSGSTENLEPIVINGLPETNGVIPEYRTKALLRPLGIKFPIGKFATNAKEAAAAAAAIGYPVVLKAQSAVLGHKSDAGGVCLNLLTELEVQEAFSQLYRNVAAYDSTIKLEGVLVEAMGRHGIEIIVGAKSDPQWGPVVMAGFGGVIAELLKDVKLFTPDMGERTIIEGLLQLQQGALLRGYRGTPVLDVAALAKLVITVGRVMKGNPTIAELDLNPVIVYPEGEGIVALDALMLIKTR